MLADQGDPAYIYRASPAPESFLYDKFVGLKGIKDIHNFMKDRISIPSANNPQPVDACETAKDEFIRKVESVKPIKFEKKTIWIFHIVIFSLLIFLSFIYVFEWYQSIGNSYKQLFMFDATVCFLGLLLFEVIVFNSINSEQKSYVSNMEIVNSPKMAHGLQWEITKQWGMKRYIFDTEEDFTIKVSSNCLLKEGRIVDIKTGIELPLRKVAQP